MFPHCFRSILRISLPKDEVEDYDEDVEDEDEDNDVEAKTNKKLRII